MAFKITSVNGKPSSYNQRGYLLNDIADLDKLPKYGIRGTMNDPMDTTADEPCAFGSTATVATGGSTDVYILTPDNEWTLM